MLLLQQMGILFLIMLVGFICQKIGLMNATGNKMISVLVVQVANPALILAAGINKTDTIEGKNLLFAVLLALGIYTLAIICSMIVPKLLKIPKRQVGTYKAMMVFSNIGFMGFPVISAVYGAQALLYASIFLIPFNVLIYTWGIKIMTENNPREESKKNKIPWGKIFNVGVISCIITMILYITKLPVPKMIETTVNYFSGLTAPLSMMVIGASMVNMKLKDLFLNRKMLVFMFIKMLLIPIIGVLIIKPMGLSRELVGVCLIMLATPVGSMNAMLTQQYDGDYELASQGVALSTILSVATMPLLSIILGV